MSMRYISLVYYTAQLAVIHNAATKALDALLIETLSHHDMTVSLILFLFQFYEIVCNGV